MDVHDRTGLAPGPLDVLREDLAPVRTLEDLLAWARAQRPPRTIAEIVTQDEYTHDVLVPWDEALWLAFDVT